MIVTHRIKMNMDTQGIAPCIHAVQGDACTRAVELSLFSGENRLKLPKNVHVLLRFRKPDGTGGSYDSLPDGACAWCVKGNVVTIVLAPQVLSVPGQVTAQIELIHGSNVLSTFAFLILVERNASVGTLESENYFNLTAWVKENLDEGLINALSVPTMVSQLTNDAGYLTIQDVDVSLKPEFANSTDECIDSRKLYVLPDGHIYAYMRTSARKYTNQLGAAGYQIGYRLSSSGGETEYTGSYLTGYIPCKAGDIVRLRNVTFQSGVTSGLTSSNQRMARYDSEKAFLSVANADDIVNTNYNFQAVLDDSGIITQFTVPETVSGVAYIRLNGSYIGDDSVITVNEEILESTETVYAWANTGHAFVPADYEDRIIELEDRTGNLSDRVAALETGVGNAEGVPAYIQEEAERVAGLVQAKRAAGSLTFTAMSDPHVFAGTGVSRLVPNLTSVRDAGLALSELRKHLTLDFTAMLGDYTYGASDCTIGQLKSDIQYFKKCMSDGSGGIPSLWMTGNHDINYGADSDRRMTEDELFAHITGNNAGTIQDCANIGRNYGYIDFENQRIRCVYLNSVDALDFPDYAGTADDALEITGVQTQWLADTGLDLSGKRDPADWQIVIFSHHPLNLYSHVLTVLEAYKNGTGGSVDVTTNGVTIAVNYDFTAENRGEIIANIHGHNHNFTAQKIGSSEQWLWRVCIPNMDTTRENEAATSSDADWAQKFGEFDSSGNAVYYKKTQGTAKSTSFCVITIDRKKRKLYAFRYGAGIDREIDY